MKKLNKDQRKQLSDFLNGLAIAWFSAGVITPFFIKAEDMLKLILQVLGSFLISALLVSSAIKNLQTRR